MRRLMDVEISCFRLQFNEMHYCLLFNFKRNFPILLIICSFTLSLSLFFLASFSLIADKAVPLQA